MDKLNFLKIKTFCPEKDLDKKMKRQATAWEKVFAKHVANKRSISRIYKELLKLNGKKQTIPLEHGQKK